MATQNPPIPPVHGPAAAEWWERMDRHYDHEGKLMLAGQSAIDLAAKYGTPTYIYSAARVSQNVARLRAAIDSIGAPNQLFYAMKSNRHAPLLAHLRGLGVGIDVASPGEVRHALHCGFELRQLSFTAGSLSRADYAALAGWSQLWINADSLTALRRLAEQSPGRQLGLRINPASALGYNELLNYSGSKPSKFGVYFDRFAEALAAASAAGLELIGLHCHAGCGFLTPQLDNLDRVFSRIALFLDAAPQITRLNLGGGLGIPLVANDDELDLNAWANLVRQHFGKRNLHLSFEPGDYLVKDAGALLTEVTQVEEKGGRIFVGVNAGFNIHPEPVFYKLPLVAAPAQRRDGPRARVVIAGNLNEALDLWAEDAELAAQQEGDVLCFLNAGGYGAAMSSQHCLRTEMTEHLLPITDCVGDIDVDQLAQANKNAWNSLYASTSKTIWGDDPLPFLDEFRVEFQKVLSTPSRVLDAGAGEGRNLPFLRSSGAAEVHAIDASKHALDKIPPALQMGLHSRVGDLAASGYPGAYFDAISLLDVFETLPNAEAVLAELYHILKPGGLLLCNIPGFDDGVVGHEMEALGADSFLYQRAYFFRFIDPQAAEHLITAAGFEILHSGRREWTEAPHPGFRGEQHEHVSHVLLMRRPLLRNPLSSD